MTKGNILRYSFKNLIFNTLKQQSKHIVKLNPVCFVIS